MGNAGPLDPNQREPGEPAFRRQFPAVLVAVLVERRPRVQHPVIEGAAQPEIGEALEEFRVQHHRLGLPPRARAVNAVVGHPAGSVPIPTPAHRPLRWPFNM